MNRAAALGKPAETLAFDLLQDELKEIIQISTNLVSSFGFLQGRVKTPFPKICAKCEKSYKNFEDFFYGTEEIAHGTVSYPILNDDFYLHRNCRAPCDSTLVVVFVDRRDESILGSRRRELFESCLHKLEKVLRIDEAGCRELLLSLVGRALDLQSQRPVKFVG